MSTVLAGNELLQQQLKETAAKLLSLLNSFTDTGINTVPGPGSWSAAQIADHILLSNTSIAKALVLEGAAINRDPAERVAELKELFLNFSIKMKAPDFILPGHTTYAKESLLLSLQHSFDTITTSMEQIDLSAMINHPAFGDITKLEIVHFVLYHTQRHLKQVSNLLVK